MRRNSVKKKNATSPSKSLSPNEWRIMRVCWRRGRSTIADLLDDLSAEPPALTFKSVHTLVVRMIDKGYLEVEEPGRRPLRILVKASREDVVRAAAESFIDETLGGEPENVRILGRVVRERRAKPKG